MQITSCPHKQAGTNQCQSPFPRPINVIPSPTKAGLIERHCSLGPACWIKRARASKILTSHTVPLNFKNHLCTIGRDDGGQRWQRETKDREQSSLGAFVCDHLGKNTKRSQQRTFSFDRWLPIPHPPSIPPGSMHPISQICFFCFNKDSPKIYI